jgi:hypothetical protein
MKTNFDKMRELNKAILEDTEIRYLLDRKSKLLNSLTPKYLVDKRANTMTAVLNEDEVRIIEKIDLFVQHRTEQIKKHFA